MKKTLLLFITLLSVTLSNAQLVLGDTFEGTLFKYAVSTAAEDGSPNTVSITGTVDGATIPDAVVIPASVNEGGIDYAVTLIASQSFKGTAITSVVIEGDTEPGHQSFMDCASLTTVSMPLSSGAIGKEAFRNCGALTDVNIPNILLIGVQSFRLCTSLKHIDLPSATAIGPSSTEGLSFWASGLETINMPVMDSIATGAFNGTPLKSITFPASLTKLSEHNYNMFRNISTLTEVIVEGSAPLVLTYSEENNPDASIFNTALSTATLKVTGVENIPAYQAAEVWKDFSSVTLGLNTLKELSFSAYPNPTTDYLIFSSKEVYSVDIYNILGAKVSSQKIINNADMTQLNKGIYFIKAKNIDGLDFETIKIIKE
jgi:hypothetical protein